MHRTLFLIPHEIGPLPLFGIGWLLILLGAGFFIRMVVAHRQWVAFQNTIPTSESAGDQANTSLPRPPSPAEVLKTEGWFWLLAGIVVAVFLPNAELQNVDGQPVGLAVRSYGAFVVMGLFSAIGLAMYRAKQRGLPPRDNHVTDSLGLRPRHCGRANVLRDSVSPGLHSRQFHRHP